MMDACCKEMYSPAMPWQKCVVCEQAYFRTKKYQDSTCASCLAKPESSRVEAAARVAPVAQVRRSEADVTDLVRQAESQAKVVGGFGEVLQIIGYSLIALFTVGLFVNIYFEQWVGVLACLICIPLTFVFFNVLGSALRAIGLYIQIKVK